MKKIITTLTVTIALVLGMMTGFTANVNAAEDNGCIPMLRLYNPNSGEHFYTGSKEEKKALVLAGWNYEGIAWHAPKTGDPVYRLYNENAGDHHYTLSAKERDNLVDLGWKYEGVAWYSDPNGTPLYRLYNPNAVSGSHHYTMSEKERDSLVDAGWTFEGEGWKANSACTCTEEPAEQESQAQPQQEEQPQQQTEQPAQEQVAEQPSNNVQYDSNGEPSDINPVTGGVECEYEAPDAETQAWLEEHAYEEVEVGTYDDGANVEIVWD